MTTKSSKVLIPLLALPLMVGLVLLFQSFGAEKSNSSDDTPIEIAFNPNKTYTLAGESFDLTSFDVLERLEREVLVNAHWTSATTINMKRTGRYFKIMEEILEANGVPTDLKYLAVAESNLEMKASPAGAKGLWQFMSATGREFGLEVSSQVDERLHVEKSTQAFCDKILADKEKFGSWLTAIAAYNMGRGGMIKVLDRQGTANYFEMNLSDETMRYPFRIMAIKEIFEHPAEYGFIMDSTDYYNPFDGLSKTIEVNASIPSLSDFAASYNMSYRELKILNPWLREHKLDVKPGKTYGIQVYK